MTCCSSSRPPASCGSRSADGIAAAFPDDLVHHLQEVDDACRGRSEVRLPLLVDYDEAAGRFEYAA